VGQTGYHFSQLTGVFAITGRHEAYYRSKKDQTFEVPMSNQEKTSVSVQNGELVHIEYSYKVSIIFCQGITADKRLDKYSAEDTATLFRTSNLRAIQHWSDNKQLYSLWLLERPAINLPLVAKNKYGLFNKNSPFGSPQISEWTESWKLWDMITLQMIPESMLHKKPIDLRHRCLFYLGHIPT
jgi:hypothetical protein